MQNILKAFGGLLAYIELMKLEEIIVTLRLLVITLVTELVRPLQCTSSGS